jgi:photosystem II stability/assembly factor-like uncharacterized protein
MKNLIFMLIIFFPLQSFSQMTRLYPEIPSDQILDIHILNQSEIILINAGGSIFKTYDGGDNWELKKFYSGYVLDEMHFLDNQTGFIKTFKNPNNYNGLVFTTDAGETWSTHNISIANHPSFMPVTESRVIKATYEGDIFLLDNFFNDWQLAYQFPTFLDTSSCCGIIETPYGGIKHFERLPEGSLLALGINENAFQHQIIDDSLSIILKSIDSGSTWDTLWIGLTSFANKITFNNNSLGWMNNDTSIFKTTDGGLNWVNQNIAGINYYIADISAVQENELYGITSRFDQQLIKSINSGNNWELLNVDKVGEYKISFQDYNTGFLFGSDLLKTENGGESWLQCDTSFKSNINDICFTSLTRGFALGNEGLFITNDGGESWNKQFVPEGIYYNQAGSIKMINDSDGWLITNTHIYKTSDGGYIWENFVLSDAEQRYGGLEFYKEDLGIIFSVSEEVSPNYFIAKYHYITTDGGASWQPKLIESDSVSQYPGYFNKVEFTDPNHLWASNINGVWLSKDTAATWQQSFINENLYGNFTFDFYNSSVGIFTRAGDTFHLTTDGGETWQSISKPAYNNPLDCKILGADISNRYRIVEAGLNGNLLLSSVYYNGTLDYGYKIDTYTNNNLNKIFVLEQADFPNVWVAGNGFSLLYRQWEKIFTGIEEEQSVPDQFELSQNYPNPFNPTTTIKFTIPKQSFVTLKIYDLLGREISTIANENMSRGIYELDFDGSNLASGIYIYRLKAGTFNSSKKFVLMK